MEFNIAGYSLRALETKDKPVKLFPTESQSNLYAIYDLFYWGGFSVSRYESSVAVYGTIQEILDYSNGINELVSLYKKLNPPDFVNYSYLRMTKELAYFLKGLYDKNIKDITVILSSFDMNIIPKAVYNGVQKRTHNRETERNISNEYRISYKNRLYEAEYAQLLASATIYPNFLETKTDPVNRLFRSPQEIVAYIAVVDAINKGNIEYEKNYLRSIF